MQHLFPEANLVDSGWVRDLAKVLRKRPWHNFEQSKALMHPAVLDAFRLARPDDWHLVVLEWPHRSFKDSSRLAYTRNERDGVADRQTLTTIGKYLTRHFGKRLADHHIRAIAARYTGSGFEIWEGVDAMIRAVTEGPTSCMQMGEYHRRQLNGKHPYEVYAPMFGWKIAVRIDADSIVSRALVVEDSLGKRFVRTYSTSDCGSYSQRDEEMEQWLIGQGYTHANCWSGAKLAKIDVAHTYLMPYVDGGCQSVADMGDHFLLSDDGHYDCAGSDGLAEDTGRACEACGNHGDEEDGFYVGYHEDTWVGGCCTDDYTYAYGRGGRQYYVPNEDCSYYNGDNYVDAYLSDNNMVSLDNGEIASMDDCSYCPVNSEWYLTEDCEYAEDRDEHVHRDDCWQCAATEKWYSDDEEFVEVDGEKYHPDDAPDEDEEETTEGVA